MVTIAIYNGLNINNFAFLQTIITDPAIAPMMAAIFANDISI